MRKMPVITLSLVACLALTTLAGCKSDSYVPNARPPATSEPGVEVGDAAGVPVQPSMCPCLVGSRQLAQR
jgi:hypothetical protein